MALAHHNYTQEWLQVYEGADFETTLSAVRRRELLASLNAHPHRHILEIGCALEPVYPYVDDFDSYTIVEPSVEMARSVSSNVATDRSKVAVLNTTIEKAAAELSKRRFDFVICSGVLHVVADPNDFLSAIRDVCDARTVCYFVVPNAASFHRILAMEMGLIERVEELSPRDCRFGHNGVYERDSIRALLRHNGFQVLRDGTFFIKPFTHEQMRQLLAENILPRAVVEGLYRLSKYFPENGCELFVEAATSR